METQLFLLFTPYWSRYANPILNLKCVHCIYSNCNSSQDFASVYEHCHENASRYDRKSVCHAYNKKHVRDILVFMTTVNESGHKITYLNFINENRSAVSTQLIANTPAFTTSVMQNPLIFQSFIELII